MKRFVLVLSVLLPFLSITNHVSAEQLKSESVSPLRGIGITCPSYNSCFDDPVDGPVHNWDCANPSKYDLPAHYIPTIYGASGIDYCYHGETCPESAGGCIPATYSGTIFSVNEPHMPGQSDLSPTEACAVWDQQQALWPDALHAAPSIAWARHYAKPWIDSWVDCIDLATVDAWQVHIYPYTSSADDAIVMLDQFESWMAENGQADKPLYVSEWQIGDSSENLKFAYELERRGHVHMIFASRSYGNVTQGLHTVTESGELSVFGCIYHYGGCDKTAVTLQSETASNEIPWLLAVGIAGALFTWIWYTDLRRQPLDNHDVSAN